MKLDDWLRDMKMKRSTYFRLVAVTIVMFGVDDSDADERDALVRRTIPIHLHPLCRSIFWYTGHCPDPEPVEL